MNIVVEDCMGGTINQKPYSLSFTVLLFAGPNVSDTEVQTIARRFKTDKYDNCPSLQSLALCKTINVGLNTFQINVRCMSERMWHIGKKSIWKCAAAIVIYNNKSDEQSMSKIINTIRLHCSKQVITATAANACEQHDFKCSQELWSFKLDAKSGYGIRGCFESVATFIVDNKMYEHSCKKLDISLGDKSLCRLDYRIQHLQCSAKCIYCDIKVICVGDSIIS
ncbi:hypothetical protein AKO1_003888 [Acrasis kona]|uniref:DUF4817 domain-containing protein n=1 Tax=Acrasis kona TaxID=1008807 RepID=A0AAW2ZFZ6_9EUKA